MTIITMAEALQMIDETPGLFLTSIGSLEDVHPNAIVHKAVAKGATHRLIYDLGHWRLGTAFQAWVTE